jgi:hypothetical protein
MTTKATTSTAAWVEAGRRFVEEDDLGWHDEPAGDVDAPAHTTGVGGHPTVSGVGQAERFEQLVGALAGLVAVQPAQPREEHQVLAAGEQFVDGGVLARERDAGADLPGLRDDVVAGHDCSTG